MTAIVLNSNSPPGGQALALQCDGVQKRYGGVAALKSVSLAVGPGRVHALLGENGAGKSTLIKIISGSVAPDAGHITIAGVAVGPLTPRRARDLGIATIYQETSLFPSLSVLENLFAQQYLRKSFGLLDWPAMREKALAVLRLLGVDLRLDALVGDLDRSSAQIVEIARALVANASILIMDEPTAALSSGECLRLYKVIDALKASGTAVIYISHHMEEIFRVADEVTILRDGQVTGNALIGDVDVAWIVQRMIGRDLATSAHVPRTAGGPVLQVRDLSCNGAVEDISFTVRAGEVVVLAGLIGSGRHELMRSLIGLLPVDRGSILLCGAPYVPEAGAHLRWGIGFVPQNRQREGLVSALSASVNLSLSSLKNVSRLGVISGKRLAERATDMFAALQVRPAQPGLPAAAFSGGNQQKIVIGRGLLAQPNLLLIEEPTQGVDIGAKEEIHRVIDDAVAAGMAVLIASSDLPEVARLADRVLVLRNGRLACEFPGGTQPAALLRAIAGESNQEAVHAIA